MDLRPLAIGELFDRAFVLYRRHFWLFVGITAVPGVFALIITLLSAGFDNPAVNEMDPDSIESAALLVGVLAAVGGLFLALAIYLVVYMVALGATTFAVSEVYLGRTATVGQVYRRMRPRVGSLVWLLFNFGWRLVGLWIVVLLFVGMAIAIHPVIGGLAMLGLFVGAGVLTILLMLRWGLSVPALVLEQRGARDSMKRSVELTRGRLGRVFLLFLCSTMVTYAGLALTQAPFSGVAMYVGLGTWTGFWLNTAGAVLGSMATTLTSPFLVIGSALIYYDARIRDEGFDLEVMMANLEGAPEPVRA